MEPGPHKHYRAPCWRASDVKKGQYSLYEGSNIHLPNESIGGSIEMADTSGLYSGHKHSVLRSLLCFGIVSVRQVTVRTYGLWKPVMIMPKCFLSKQRKKESHELIAYNWEKWNSFETKGTDHETQCSISIQTTAEDHLQRLHSAHWMTKLRFYVPLNPLMHKVAKMVT